MSEIRKLIVLNGSESHKFEVDKQYANSEVQEVYKIVPISQGGYRVWFAGKGHVDVISNNVLVFY